MKIHHGFHRELLMKQLKSSYYLDLSNISQTAVGGGFRKIISGNGQISVVGQDNEKMSFNVSEDTSKAFARDQARVRSEAIQQTFNDTQGLDYITNIAKIIKQVLNDINFESMNIPVIARWAGLGDKAAKACFKSW